MSGSWSVAFVLLTACAAAGRQGPPVASLGPLPAKSPLSGKPGVTQAGVHRTVDAGLLRKGKWDKNGWKLTVQSPDAKGLRLHFTGADLGDRKLVVRGAGGSVQTFAGRGPNGDGDFWTGLIEGDSATLEMEGNRPTALPFKVAELSHLWVLP